MLQTNAARLTACITTSDRRMSLTPAELERFVADLAATPERWRHAVRHADGRARLRADLGRRGGQRLGDLLERGPGHRLSRSRRVLGAAIAVISGHVREDRLRLGRPASLADVRPRHRSSPCPPLPSTACCTRATRPAVTIHAYSPPLARTGAYRIGAHGELERELLTYEEELRATAALS